ncbi:MAG: DUF1501 domain-containing protein [Chitinophagales bacterium]|nr:DUF1501 domain-containing protein [Chitinophagales bacterium]
MGIFAEIKISPDMNRRKFIQTGALATTALWMPKFLKAFEPPGALPPGGKILVLIQLSGGNDGLNTIIPYRNDIYYRERPRLAIQREQALSLNEETGLHPSLSGLKNLYDQGYMSVLNGVGYPNPDRSHFRSMDIWHSASPAEQYWSSGWLGRYLDAQYNGCAQPTGVLEIDDTLSLALKGVKNKGLAFEDPRRLHEAAHSPYFSEYVSAHPKPRREGGGTTGHVEEEAPVEYLYKTMAETLSSADYIFDQSRKKSSSAVYPATELGKNLKTVASLILADSNTTVYYLSLGSFDTHINQDGQQRRLFEQLDGAIAAFAADMQANGKWNEVLVATFSEFGRRVSQNASNGTDHGTANNMMFFGGGLRRQGILNAMSDLENLKDGDLQFQVDFRQVYATLLERWLRADSTAILQQSFEPLSFL